jgi:hypothetical protein
MAENPRIPMPFGSGLDRDTGIMAVRPGSFEDIRNVLLHQGKAIVRQGFGSPLVLLDDEGNVISDVVAGEALRSERVGIVVSYQATTGKVWVHRTDADGTLAERMGEWVNDNVTVGRPTGWDATTPPRVSMAESYGNVFIAHDTNLLGERAQTIYYAAGSLVPLTSDDWGGRGTEEIRFRGVVRHLNYMSGWGFGDTITDRPEFVRMSVAGAPTTFEFSHYFQAGDRNDPVLLCAPAGGRLLVFKEAESYYIQGSSRTDFGIKLLDPRYGILASQLGVNYGSTVLVWSLEGPRVFDGRGESTEISIPLDLGGLEPASLVPEGAAAIAFAMYVPDQRVVLFVFGRRVYALTVRVEGDWKWSYWEMGFDPLCGFTLFSQLLDAIAPTGFPEYAASVSGGTYSDVTIANRDADGDETLEAWWQEDPAGSWIGPLSEAVELSPTQIVNIPGLTPGTTYNLAFRYRRGSLYNAGSENTSDPSTWLPISQAQITTTIDPPTFFSGVWERTATAVEEIHLTITPAVGLEAQDIEVFCQGRGSIGTISGPHGGDALFDDTTALGLTGEQYNVYTFVTKGATDSPPSAQLLVWSGPPGQPVILWANGQGPEYAVGWTKPAHLEMEVWDDYDDAGGVNPSKALRWTRAAGPDNGTSPALVNVPVSPGLNILIAIRQKATAFTTDDFSPWSDPHPEITIMDPWV